MTFGLRNTAQTFERFMDQVLCGLNFVYNYIDNVLIASPDAEEHKQHLMLVLERLQKYGVLINPAKCVLVVCHLQFLRHQIDHQGIRPHPHNLGTVMEFPRPTTTRKLREFFGLVNSTTALFPTLRASSNHFTGCCNLPTMVRPSCAGPMKPLQLSNLATRPCWPVIHCYPTRRPMLRRP